MKKAYTFLIAALSVCTCHTVQAELNIKKLFIKDCPKAVASVTALTEPQREEFVSFLMLLLKQAPATPDQAPVGAMSSLTAKGNSPLELRLEDNASGDLFRFLDASHDSRSKSCALDALILLTPYSFKALPVLLEVSATIAVDSSVRDRIATVIQSIILSTKAGDSFNPNPDIIDFAVKGISAPYNALAENMLIELGAVSINKVLDELKSSDVTKRNRAQQLLLKIDPSGELLVEPLTALFRSGEANVRARILFSIGKLPKQSARTISLLFAGLDDTSAEVQEAALSACHQLLSRKAIHSQHYAKLFSRSIALLSGRPEKARNLPQKVTAELLDLYSAGLSQLIQILFSAEDSLVLRTLQILKETSIDIDDEATKALTAILTTASERIVVDTLPVLSRVRNQKLAADAIANLVQQKKKGILGTEKITRESLKALSSFSTTQAGGVKLIPEALLLIPYNRDIEDAFLQTHPASIFLKKYAKEALPFLVKALKSSDQKQRVGEILLANAIAPKDPVIIDAALAFLQQDDGLIRKASESILMKTEAAVSKKLETLLKHKNPQIRFSAAKILGYRGSKNPSIVPVLVGESAQASCVEVTDAISTLVSLQGGISPQIFSRVIQCVQSHSITLDEFENAARAAGSLPEASKQDLLALLNNPETDTYLRLKLIELAQTINLPATDVTIILTKYARHGDTALALVSFEALRALGSQAGIAGHELLDIANSSDIDPIIRHEAALVAAQVAPEKDEFINFFIEQLQRDARELTIKTISRLPRDQMKQVVSKAFESITGEDRRSVIRLIGVLPASDALAFSAQLENLMKTSKVPETRLEALVTLLKINPGAPELAAPLKETLVSVTRDDLLAQRFPANVKPVFEAMLPGTKSRLVRLGLETLIENIEPKA